MFLKNKQLFKFKKHTSAFLLIVGFGLIGFAGVNAWDWYSRTQGAARPPDPGQTITYSADKPDEKPIPVDAEYNVAADQPKKIYISNAGVEGFIQKVGKDQHGKIGAPSNVHFAGWFAGSSRPGDTGLSIMDGHVSSRYGPAIFDDLNKLKPGDTLKVQFGDNSTRIFQVIEIRELPEAESAGFLFEKRPDTDAQLNIITCGGDFNKKLARYDNRIVVVTKRIN